MFLKLMLILAFALLLNFCRYFLKLKRNKKVLKPKKLITFNKKNLNNWMNLTKKERYNLSKQDSMTYLDKRKLLLAEIRNEYKKISKLNSDKTQKKNNNGKFLD